jgi:hypothetical protein
MIIIVITIPLPAASVVVAVVAQQSAVTSLSNLDMALTNMTSLLAAAISNLASFSSGRCDAGTAALGSPCTDNAACGVPGGLCVFAVRRCEAPNFGISCDDGTDTPCLGGKCLFQAPVYTALSAALTSWRDSPVTVDAGPLVVRQTQRPSYVTCRG